MGSELREIAASLPLLVVILGPTASGKTALSLALAQEFDGEVSVNCDSVAMVREFDIGTAKPSAQERARAPHHLFDCIDPTEYMTAGEYARQARQLLAEISGRGHLPIVVGGTGLYLRVLLEGLFPGPQRSEELRERLRESAVGVHWNFFPDADVNSNPANPIINTRSFGEDPKQVGDLVTAYIKGAREGGMLTTVKHFPGHGDTATDSHLGVASVNVDRAHLDSIELPPFRQAIAAGVDSVMVAHVTVPALDPDPNHVATISTAVVSDLLEKQLGFKGLIVTDALDMAGVTHLFAQRHWTCRSRGLQGGQRSAHHSSRLPRFVRIHAEGSAV